MGRTACTEPQCLYKGALYLYLYSCEVSGIFADFSQHVITSPDFSEKNKYEISRKYFAWESVWSEEHGENL